MGRYPRPNLPGVAFHLTARVQHRAHLFTAPLRDRIVSLLGRDLARCDATLLAYVVMTNHLHLVLIQGEQPLSALMQPFLRSVALHTHAVYETEGHVFERRFGDRVCRDPDHLRNAIAYTHANPVRAGMCANPGAYPWSSHRLYVGERPLRPPPPLAVTLGLSAFHPGGGRYHRARRRDSYRERLDGILHRAEDRGDPEGPGRRTPHERSGPGSTPPSLEAVAEATLALSDAQQTLVSVRSRWGPRSRLRARSRIALAASRAGYSGRQIAAFLGVSEPTISRDLATERAQPHTPPIQP